MSKNTFVKASISGDYGQELVMKYLQDYGYETKEAPKKLFYDWDVKGIKGGREVTIEVKYDSKAYYWAARRGNPEQPNLYIEFRSTTRNEDSGILKSKADFYFYILKTGDKDIAFVFNRVQLLQHLQMSNYKIVGNSATGDDNAEGWIPPLHELLVARYGYKATIDLTPYA
jgi:hypothetical protein